MYSALVQLLSTLIVHEDITLVLRYTIYLFIYYIFIYLFIYLSNWYFRITFLFRIPDASRASKLLRFSLKALVGVVLAWGCYKIGKYTGIGSYIPFVQ